MIRKLQRKTAAQTHHSMGALLFLTILLVIGMLAGAYFAAKYPQSAPNVWPAHRGFQCFIYLFWQGFRFLLPIACFAFFRIGLLGIPCLFIWKGFSDAFSITHLLLSYGKAGLAASVLVQSSIFLISVFSMLLIALPSYRLCGMLMSVPKGNSGFLKIPPDPSYWFGAMASLFILILFSFLGCFIFPFLWQTAAALIQ